jgi:hypothetical protein
LRQSLAVAQDDLLLAYVTQLALSQDPHASASQVLGLQVCINIPSLTNLLRDYSLDFEVSILNYYLFKIFLFKVLQALKYTMNIVFLLKLLRGWNGNGVILILSE